MSRLRIVHSDSVDQHQRLAEIAAADGEIGLKAIRRARVNVQRWIETEIIEEGVGESLCIVIQLDGADGAVGLVQRRGFVNAGDDHYIGSVGKSWSLGRGAEAEAQED